jgi:TDG/mug DNA glycosylase family protein
MAERTTTPYRVLEPGETLPDYLRADLRLLIIGINPGTYSTQVGHYYARPGNLFWWAISNSGLVSQPYTAAEDHLLLEREGIGLTDVVKRPTNSSGELLQAEFDEGRKLTSQKIETYAPRVVCFVGLLGATAFLGRQVEAGPLHETIGKSRLFAMPSPSRRNAHYGKERILEYFKELNRFVSTAPQTANL